MLPTMKNRIIFPNHVNGFFENNFNPFLDTKTKKDEIPSVNILEDENKFEIHLAVPGYNKEDIKIEVDKGVLTISSEQEEENKEENKDFTRKEFSVKTFTSRFSLPDTANTAKIKASNNLGILTVEIPKVIEKIQKPKLIKVD